MVLDSLNLRQTARAGCGRILLLMSNTGGGHRACSNALRDALLERDPELQVDIVDGLEEAGAFPLPHMPKLYTRWSERRHLWGAFFHATNGRRWSNMVTYPLERRSRPGIRQLIVDHDPDVVVVLHPCLTNVTLKAARSIPRRPRVVTAVTDLVYGHASWFAHGADAYYVPTKELADVAMREGIPASKIMITGLPLATRLFQLRARKAELRERFGFNRMTVVCVGGADGMGIQRLMPSLTTIADDIDVHVVCGKNAELQSRLTRQQLPANFRVHGFIPNLPEMLAAADLALIKASPTVLMEAVTVGARVLIYDFLPGQESPNVGYVRAHGLGDCSRSPRVIARKIDALAGEWREGGLRNATSFTPMDGARILAAELLQA